jgi:hypothetical protein
MDGKKDIKNLASMFESKTKKAPEFVKAKSDMPTQGGQ